MDHVLVPMDDSDPARTALEYACERYPGAELTVLYVAEPTESGVYTSMTGGRSDHGERRARAEAVFETARELAAEYDRTVSTELFAGDAARAIVQFAEEAAVDHVVIGSHGRTGASRVLLGSVAETVARRSPTPVTIVR
ncbi:universal stress protein [Natronobeatus ordinarius]|uniref:universal stress protein n=1 Tax=Natronobeatus ordinarius TaxID=2963433 RepID=UPI0020CC68BC|nr:universal stress protein [Natronobeatus ordinarius]